MTIARIENLVRDNLTFKEAEEVLKLLSDTKLDIILDDKLEELEELKFNNKGDD